MSVEIERKFLVADNSWQDDIERTITIMQGYLYADKQKAIRIRIQNEEAFLTIKGSTGSDVTRLEYEYEIPIEDATEMLSSMTDQKIIKYRCLVTVGDHVWEVDMFQMDNDGLVVAEIELSSEDEDFVLPTWLGMEVTSDPRYLNSNLIEHPYCNWNKQ